MNIINKSALFIFLVVFNTWAIFISSISDTAWHADVAIMNASLGIDESFIVEDFEDPDFVSGLSWTKINTNEPGTGPELNITSVSWDGERALFAEHNFHQGDAVFSFTDPLSMFGIGVSDLNPGNSIDIYTDGILLGNTVSFENFIPGIGQRTGYLWITADEGESFTQVTLVGNSDQLQYDHCAFRVATGASSTVPEPPLLPLAGGGFFMLFIGEAIRHRRCRVSTPTC